MENNKSEIIYSLEQINLAVELLEKLTTKNNIMALSGTLGAGKTTLIQNFLKAQGVEQAILSPTFNYFNQYKVGNKNFYHFDLYRLSNLDEFMSLGFEELINEPNSISLIEWPEIIEPLINKSSCHIFIDYYGFDKRVLSYKCY